MLKPVVIVFKQAVVYLLFGPKIHSQKFDPHLAYQMNIE
jgi:hypothetical protein